MSRRLSRIGQGIGPYLEPGFVSKLKSDKIVALSLHSNELEGLEVQFSSNIVENSLMGNQSLAQQVDQRSLILTNELTMLVDLDVSSNKLGGNRDETNECAPATTRKQNFFSLLLLASNLKIMNLSANFLTARDLGRILQPLTFDMNMSCSPVVRQLQNLNLSHNDLQSLPETLHIACPLLCQLNIVGNYISNLSTFVKSLYLMRDTIEVLMLQERDESSRNPICSIRFYREHMLRFFPNLKQMDGLHVSAEEKKNAATKVEFMLLEQDHQNSEGDDGVCKNTRPSAIRKSSKKEHLQSTLSATAMGKLELDIDYVTARLAEATGVALPLMDAGKAALRKKDTLESKIKQLKAISEEQSKTTKALLAYDNVSISRDGAKGNIDSAAPKRRPVANVRYLVHQECQVDSSITASKETQSVEIQTEGSHSLLNSEAQTDPDPELINRDRRYLAISALFIARKSIQFRLSVGKQLIFFSFQYWKSTKDSFRRKEQARKLQQYCKKSALAKQKWKEALLECEENLCSSEIVNGQLQQQISSLEEENKHQKENMLQNEQHNKSICDQLHESEKVRVGLDLSISKLQEQLEELNLDRTKEFQRAENLLPIVEEYKTQCNILQGQVAVLREDLQENNRQHEVHVNEMSKENQSSIEIARQEALALCEEDLKICREKADKQVRQLKQAYQEIALKLANEKVSSDQAVSEKKSLEEAVQRMKTALCEQQSSLAISKERIVDLEQENQRAKQESNALKSFSSKAELKNRRLVAALAEAKESFCHIENELEKRKRSENRRVVTTDKLEEKIEFVIREKEEIDHRCQILIRERNFLSDELEELRNKYQRISSVASAAFEAGPSKEKALKRVIKEHVHRIESLQRDLTEKSEAFRFCEGELVGLRSAYQEKEMAMRREFEQDAARLQQTEEINHRNLCIRLQTVEEELKHVDGRRAHAEAAVSYAETHLAAERETRIVAEREVKRLTQLLDEQAARTKSAVQGLLIQTGLCPS